MSDVLGFVVKVGKSTLFRADFTRCCAVKADFTSVDARKTNFTNADLRSVRIRQFVMIVVANKQTKKKTRRPF